MGDQSCHLPAANASWSILITTLLMTWLFLMIWTKGLQPSLCFVNNGTGSRMMEVRVTLRVTNCLSLNDFSMYLSVVMWCCSKWAAQRLNSKNFNASLYDITKLVANRIAAMRTAEFAFPSMQWAMTIFCGSFCKNRRHFSAVSRTTLSGVGDVVFQPPSMTTPDWNFATL